MARPLFPQSAGTREPSVKRLHLDAQPDSVEALARAKGKHCLAWLHRRLVRQLKPLGEHYSGGGAVPFWFAIEEAAPGSSIFTAKYQSATWALKANRSGATPRLCANP